LTVLRILIWNLADSKTTLGELRERVPPSSDRDIWITNDAQERFGLVSTSETLPDLKQLRDLIGKDPEVVEEYDTLA
jgi:hypothetical protein